MSAVPRKAVKFNHSLTDLLNADSQDHLIFFNGDSYTDKMACWYWNGPMYLLIGMNCSVFSIVDGGPFISFSFIARVR